MFEHVNNITLLLVDDEPANREFIVSYFIEINSTVNILSATSAKQGLQILDKKHVDLIILDWDMPEMDGLEMLKKVKTQEATKEVPVIMYTGVMTHSHNLAEAMQAGADDFLRKPTDVVEMQARINSVLAKHTYYKEKIAALKKDLDSSILLLSHKNSILQRLKEMASSIHINPEFLISYINQELTNESYWDDFFQKYKAYDAGFIERLSIKSPDITPTDIKLCTLIRMNMDNKTMAQALNVTLAAIEKGRYRLRKKLNLPERQSLEKEVFSI